MTLLQGLARSMRPLVGRNPRLAMAYRHYRDMAHAEREPVATPLGFKFIGHPAMEAGTFEPDEVRVMQHLLRNADVLVNVGANFGYYCCIALQAGVQVVAIEPVPNNLRCLYRNLIANGWGDRAEVLPVAVGSRRGLVDIYGGGTAASLLQGWAGIPADYCQTVPLTTLDDCMASRLGAQRCVVLVDVEGAELDVLTGARALLQSHPKPVWMMEISIDEHFPGGAKINPNLCATFERFERAGYGAWAVEGRLVPIDYAEPREIARTGINTLRTHNFVFAEPAAVAGLALGA